jgi:hypothetical protein
VLTSYSGGEDVKLTDLARLGRAERHEEIAKTEVAVEGPASWADYIRRLADAMHLRDWTFELVAGEQPDRADAAASILVTYGRKDAAIRLATDWGTYPPDRQRHYLVHELVHAHQEAIHIAANNARDLLGTAAWAVLDGCHRDAIEVATDALAEIIAPFMPLPEEAQ